MGGNSRRLRRRGCTVQMGGNNRRLRRRGSTVQMGDITTRG